MTDIKNKNETPGGLFDALMTGMEAIAGGAEKFLVPEEGMWKCHQVTDAETGEDVWEVSGNGKRVTCYDAEMGERVARLLNGG